MAVISSKSLAEKLGVKEGFRAILINAPENYDTLLNPSKKKIIWGKKLSGMFDFIQCFTEEEKSLTTQFPQLKKYLKPDGMLWVSWPKITTDSNTDFNEDLIRKTGLKFGLIDTIVCAVDDKWSGLKFMYRLQR